MGKNTLIIVESSPKIDAIEKILSDSELDKSLPNRDYIATNGHLFDLTNADIGVSFSNSGNIILENVFINGKYKLLEGLKNKAAQAGDIYIFTDADIEGERIAYDVVNYLIKTCNVEKNQIHRVVSSSITKKAVINAFLNCEKIDNTHKNKYVRAQSIRRAFDKLVGHVLSSLLLSQGYDKGLGRSQLAILFSVNNIELISYYDRKKEINIPLTIKGYSTDTGITVRTNTNYSLPTMYNIVSSASGNLFTTYQILQALYNKGCITYLRTKNILMSEDYSDYLKAYNIKVPKSFIMPTDEAITAHEGLRFTLEFIELFREYYESGKLIDFFEDYDIVIKNKTSLYELIHIISLYSYLNKFKNLPYIEVYNNLSDIIEHLTIYYSFDDFDIDNNLKSNKVTSLRDLFFVSDFFSICTPSSFFSIVEKTISKYFKIDFSSNGLILNNEGEELVELIKNKVDISSFYFPYFKYVLYEKILNKEESEIEDTDLDILQEILNFYNITLQLDSNKHKINNISIKQSTSHEIDSKINNMLLEHGDIIDDTIYKAEI
ncbi:hypothetical protein DEFDS_P014 (plasmid) [Deferribacter desulfuricans SSM1]|uniref:Toprim domain-containing protein n=1 Tax=Deferribacter desulfuricans (strain DSM 14783 / JCM 11476 / NBRC 101012 / SSM1) TaxID=639282 RepID=D3PEK0_DEFDS|nr:toprim domain-containing protein [Deferribacter desulfuricans]BAI81642.1 hypothetical protein DEFDS_P014 [Deferribacter desulfuricans SSM1]